MKKLTREIPRAASFSISEAAASRLLPPEWDGATHSRKCCALHPDHPLAAVFAGQQSDQRLRRVLEAVDDVLLDLQLARRDPGLQVGQRLVALIHEIHHDEALHDQALHHDQAGYAA